MYQNRELNSQNLVILTCATISIVCSYIYFVRIEQILYEFLLRDHNIILSFDGVDNAPFKYRILIPIIAEILKSIFLLIFNEKISFQLSYILINVISIFLLTFFSFTYFYKYFKFNTSIIGILLLGMLINIPLKDMNASHSILDSAFFVMSLLLIKNKKFYLLIPLIIIALLNRETAILILVIFFIKQIFLKKIDKKNISIFSILFFSYFIIFFGLRFILGEATHVSQIDGGPHYLISKFYANIDFKYLSYTIFLYFMLFGFLWIYAVIGFKKINLDLKENYLVLLFYLPLIWLFGAWYEVRLFMPMFCIVLPGLLVFFEKEN